MEATIFLILFFVLSAFGSLYEVVVLTEKNTTSHRLIQQFSKDPKKFLLFFQLLITASNLGIGFVSESLFANVSNSFKWLGFLTVTVSVILFAEILPKQFGFFYSRFFLGAGSDLVLWLYKVLKPATSSLNALISFLLKLFKFRDQVLFFPEELEQFKSDLYDLLKHKSVSFSREALKILNALSVARVKEVLIPRTLIDVVKVDELEQVKELLLSGKVKVESLDRTIFVKDGAYFIVADQDVEKKLMSNESLRFSEAPKCSSLDYVLEVLVLLNRNASKLAVCFDEFGSLDGIFNPVAVLNKIYSWSQAYKISENKVILSGQTRLSFVELIFDASFDEADSSRTISSCFLEKFGLQISVGAHFWMKNVRFKVLKLNESYPEFVEVTKA
ncbi:MAG: CNNM domain-containing protein [Deltaproteobacteria bacterium]|nr:CNNM domain-containing protein [Deltaproteobacteria bacterium]